VGKLKVSERSKRKLSPLRQETLPVSEDSGAFAHAGCPEAASGGPSLAQMAIRTVSLTTFREL